MKTSRRIAANPTPLAAYGRAATLGKMGATSASECESPYESPTACPSCRRGCTLSPMTPEQAGGLPSAPEAYRLCPYCRGIFRKLTLTEKVLGTVLLAGL